MDEVNLLQGEAHSILVLGIAWNVGRPELEEVQGVQNEAKVGYQPPRPSSCVLQPLKRGTA